jgi:5-methylthioribose kinase
MDANAAVLHSLERLGLIASGERPTVAPIMGGVSGDVFQVEVASGPVCVKRALERLRVAGDWTAPLERSGYEVAWLKTVAAIDSALVPRVIADDPAAYLFVMQYLEPLAHPVWKAHLAAGRIDPAFAAKVGDALGRIHAKTAHDADIAARFDTARLFNALRIEPYLLTTAKAHADLAAPLEALAAETLAAKIALVHGDVSPKNILVGPHGPVILDAECAWCGDPAFDVAFVATHLLLKTLWRPAFCPRYMASLDALLIAYVKHVDWEPKAALDRRTAALLPALLLARVDGKSPVEYLTDEEDRAFVRALARPLIKSPVGAVSEVLRLWTEGLQLR